ncbi:hypothetical protein ACG7TL_006114 [Trametes sanguinea]
MAYLNVTYQGNTLGRVPLQVFANLLQSVNSTHTPLPNVETLESMQSSFATALSLTRHALNRQQSRIHRVPVEILTMIFRLVIDITSSDPPDEGHEDFAGTFPAIETLLTLTSVCQRWREIMLKHPSFWTVIDSQNMNAAETFLQRSGDHLSLVVHISSTNQFLPAPPFLREHRLQPRLREIHWTTSEGTPRKADYLLFPAPRLELLRLLDDAEDRARDEVYRNMPPILFAGHAPLLRTLYLGRIGWLPGNRFRSLTFLCLSDIYSLEFPEIVRLLCNCPVLEHLQLFRIKARAPPDRPPMPGLATDQVTLPKLYCFTFVGMSINTVNDFIFYLAGYQARIALEIVDTPPASAQPVIAIETLAQEAIMAFTDLTIQHHLHEDDDVVSIVAEGEDVEIKIVSGPSTFGFIDGRPHIFASTHWGLCQAEVFPLNRLRHFFLEFFNVRLPQTFSACPSARNVRSLVARMTALQEFQLRTHDLRLLFLQVFSREDDAALLPLPSEVPDWRLPALSITLVPQEDVPPNPNQQLAIPDLTDVLRVVGRIVFAIPFPPEAYRGVVDALFSLQRQWGQERITVLRADPIVAGS